MRMREPSCRVGGGVSLIRQSLHLGLWLAALTLLITSLGCEGTAVDATSTATPTLTPIVTLTPTAILTPTPTPTPGPMLTPSPTPEPTATEPPAIQSVDRKFADELMALVPADFDSAVFTDIKFPAPEP